MVIKVLISLILYFFSFDVFPAEGNGGMPQLNPETFSSQLFWLAIFFFIIFIVNHFFFLPKIENIRNLREKTINENTKQIKDLNDSISDIVKKMENDLKSAMDDYNTNIKRIYDKHKKEYEIRIGEFNQKIEEKKKEHSNLLIQSEKKIRNEFPRICVSLSDKLYENIMNEKKKSTISEFKKFDGEK